MFTELLLTIQLQYGLANAMYRQTDQELTYLMYI